GGEERVEIGRVRDYLAHPGNSARLDQLGDQVQFADAFEVGDLWRDAAGAERLDPGDEDFGDGAPDHGLLVEQDGFGFLGEARGDDPGAAAADRAAVGESKSLAAAGRILVHGTPREHAFGQLVERAERGPGPLRREQEDVEVAARLDESEADRQAVAEAERSAAVKMRLD